ncbi:MAG: hypothetical protein IJL87_10590 [Clostridia bacterium]|nr:hypothetical protein [Clostridia bacterium]
MKKKKNDPLSLALELLLKMLMGLLFCFVLNMFFNSTFEKGKTFGLVILQIVELLIYGGLVYGYMWKVGSRDINKVNFNRMKKDNLRGLKIALIAMIPNVISYLILIIGKIAGWSNGVAVVYRALGICYVPVIFRYILTTPLLSEISLTRVILSGVTLLFVPAVAEGAYLLGLNGYSLSERLVYKTKQDNK